MNSDAEGGISYSMDEEVVYITKAIKNRLTRALDATINRRDETLKQLIELEQCEMALSVVRSTQKHPNAVISPVGLNEKPPFLETRVNIGHEFYVQAHIFQPEPLIVDAGLGILTEMSIDEAADFYNEKKTRLKQIIDEASGKIDKIRLQIEQLISLFSNLQEVPPSTRIMKLLSHSFPDP